MIEKVWEKFKLDVFTKYSLFSVKWNGGVSFLALTELPLQMNINLTSSFLYNFPSCLLLFLWKITLIQKKTSFASYEISLFGVRIFPLPVCLLCLKLQIDICRVYKLVWRLKLCLLLVLTRFFLVFTWNKSVHLPSIIK